MVGYGLVEVPLRVVGAAQVAVRSSLLTPVLQSLPKTSSFHFYSETVSGPQRSETTSLKIEFLYQQAYMASNKAKTDLKLISDVEIQFEKFRKMEMEPTHIKQMAFC